MGMILTCFVSQPSTKGWIKSADASVTDWITSGDADLEEIVRKRRIPASAASYDWKKIKRNRLHISCLTRIKYQDISNREMLPIISKLTLTGGNFRLASLDKDRKSLCKLSTNFLEEALLEAIFNETDSFNSSSFLSNVQFFIQIISVYTKSSSYIQKCKA